jgi:hypothetical protein
MNTTDTQNTKTTKLTHHAFQVRGNGDQSYWTRIGAAWAHKDGKGFTLQLDCVPLDGRISLRLPQEEK